MIRFFRAGKKLLVSFVFILAKVDKRHTVSVSNRNTILIKPNLRRLMKMEFAKPIKQKKFPHHLS